MGMTNEEVIKLAQRLITDFKCESDTIVDFCNTVIKKFEQQPCDDCISREDSKNLFLDGTEGYDCRGFTRMEIGEMLDELPSVTPQQTSWIPVTERLPEKDEVVLITNKWHEVDKALYIGGEMFDIIINYLQKEEVIAWMPLPEPYKAESEGEE